MTDPLFGRDGTHDAPPDTPGPDARAAPVPRRGEHESLPALPALPALPRPGDRDAVERRTDAAAASRRASDPPNVRDAGPVRVVADRSPAATRQARQAGQARPSTTPTRPATTPTRPATGRRPERRATEHEPDWKRERREEAEFRAEFGNWRAGAAGTTRPGGRRPRSGSGLGVVTLLVVMVLVVLVVLIAAA